MHKGHSPLLLFTNNIIKDMCTIINIQHGAIALLGDCSKQKIQIKDLKHTIELYIQYDNQCMTSIAIQIDKSTWKNDQDELNYIRNLMKTEVTARLYDKDKKPINL